MPRGCILSLRLDAASLFRALRRPEKDRLEQFFDFEMAAAAKENELLASYEPLERLATEDEQIAGLVKLRFFVGLTNKETAEIVGVFEPTVERRWAFARLALS